MTIRMPADPFRAFRDLPEIASLGVIERRVRMPRVPMDPQPDVCPRCGSDGFVVWVNGTCDAWECDRRSGQLTEE